MLLTSNRVCTAFELGFATWDRGSYSRDVRTMLRVRNLGVAGRNLCRQKLFVGFSDGLYKGDPTRTVDHPFLFVPNPNPKSLVSLSCAENNKESLG